MEIVAAGAFLMDVIVTDACKHPNEVDGEIGGLSGSSAAWATNHSTSFSH